MLAMTRMRNRIVTFLRQEEFGMKREIKMSVFSNFFLATSVRKFILQPSAET